MIPRSLRKSAEFLTRQMVLALTDMTGHLADRIRAATDPLKKARALLAEALRLIDRNSHDGAGAAGRLLRAVAVPFFGVDDCARLGAVLR